MREAVARKPQALIVEPEDPADAELARAVGEALAARVPVIVLGKPITGVQKGPGAARMIVVGPQSFTDSARKMVELSIRNARNAKLNPEGGAILLVAPPSDRFLDDRVAAVREALKAAKITTVNELLIPRGSDAGAEVLKKRLLADPKPCMVFTFDFNSTSASNNAASDIVEKRPFIQSGYTSDESLPRMAVAGEFGALAEFVPTRLTQRAVSVAAAAAQGRNLKDREDVPILVKESPPTSAAPIFRPNARPATHRRRPPSDGLRARMTAAGRPRADRGVLEAPAPGATRQDLQAMDQNRTDFVFGELERRNLDALLPLALAEDLGQVGDITSTATIPSHARGAAHLVARSRGVLAGLPVAERLADEFELREHWRAFQADGDVLEAGTIVACLAGSMRSLLTMERTVLNFLQRLSGIASLTSRFVAATAGTRAAIYDTRKTTPGWRALEKYAVRCGGGRNHRFGLYDAVLIKDNHLAWLRASAGLDIAAAVATARANVPAGTVVEVEVDTLEQLDVALGSGPDIVLVDNLGPVGMAEAVRRRDAVAPTVLLEASGGVSLATVAALAATGVDRISVGALTHSAPALDLAMDFEPEAAPDRPRAEG